MAHRDLPGALRARDALLRIAADDDLDQTAKLFAFCLLAYKSSPQPRDKKRSSWAQAVGEMMTGESRTHTVNMFGEQRIYGSAIETVRRVIRNDIPRYEVPYTRIVCPIPKTRGPNAGKPCGKNTTHSWVERNPETGEGTRIGYCSGHHTRAHTIRWQQAHQQWEANGHPTPPANKGGILARHFNSNWAKLYNWADPTREPLPNGKPPTPPRPTFTLIQGGSA